MANETHIKWLLEGKTLWNQRREEQEFQPDLSCAQLSDLFRDAGKLDHNGRVPLCEFNLSNAIFRGTNLTEVDFLRANLRDAHMLGAIFCRTSFSQADLSNATFGPCYLGEADLSSTVLEKTALADSNLTGANLSWSRFWQADLYADFRGLGRLESDLEKHDGTKPHRVSSVASLIKKCFEIRNRNKGLTLYFRGERDHTWCLRPSVMRKSSNGTFRLRAHEGEMLRDLMSRRPEDFRDMTSALEQIVMGQHHGLKTRLLDVTRNPCVALFSACDARDPAGIPHDNKMNGRIHVFAAPKGMVKTFDSDVISVIANFTKLDRSYQNLLLGKTGKDSEQEDPEVPIQYLYDEAMRRLYHFIRQEKPQFEAKIQPRDLFRVFIVEPKQSFERIRSQEGAFILSAFHERFERKQIQSYVQNMMIYAHETIIVPGGKKQDLLEELSLLNFTREALYPSLDEVANKITQEYL